MKYESAIIIGIAWVIGLIALGALVYFISTIERGLNASLVESQLIEPAPGMTCVVITTSDGVAVDCWEGQADVQLD